MLIRSLISTILGTRMPGEGTIYLEQTLKFLHPVFINDTVTARVEITKFIKKEKGIIQLKTDIFNQDGMNVITGYCVVKIPV